MNLNLSHKVFLVTGGAQGIGEAIVRLLAKEGGIPIVVDKNEAKAKQLAEDLNSRDQQAHAIGLDLSDFENCESAIRDVISKLGRLDGLINNAGTNDGVSLENGTPESYLKSLEKNQHHYYYMAHYALPHLKKTQGSILNISSKTAITGQGGTSAYAGAKGAQLAFTREWAVELLPYQIRVNAIVPSEVMTPMYQNWLDTFPNPDKKLNEINQNIPFGNRMTKADEIASTAVFLLSEKAAHITGQHLFVDGGYVHLDRSLAGLQS